MGTGQRRGKKQSLRKASRSRNSKSANMPPTASKPMGENEMASRQRNEIPLVEHKVVSRQRHEMRGPNPMVQMAEMMKDL